MPIDIPEFGVEIGDRFELLRKLPNSLVVRELSSVRNGRSCGLDITHRGEAMGEQISALRLSNTAVNERRPDRASLDYAPCGSY